MGQRVHLLLPFNNFLNARSRCLDLVGSCLHIRYHHSSVGVDSPNNFVQLSSANTKSVVWALNVH